MLNKVLFGLIVFFLLGSNSYSEETQVEKLPNYQYQQKTIQDAVNQHKVKSIQLMNYALIEAVQSGYGQALIDYEIVVGTEPAKVKERPQGEEDGQGE